MSETIIQDTLKNHNLRYVILRYFNVAGADPLYRTGQSSLPASHLIRVACQTACKKRDFLPIFGNDYKTPDGTCIRDYIHVSDLIEAHINAIDYLKEGGSSDVFNCGYGKGYSVHEVLNAVKKVSGKDFKIKILNKRLGDPISLIANNNKILRKLKWSPKYNNLNSIVTDALNWEKN